jgi:hypothetical protein
MVASRSQALALLCIVGLSQSMAFRQRDSDRGNSKGEVAESFVPPPQPNRVAVGGAKRSDVAAPQVGTFGVGGNVKTNGAPVYQSYREALRSLRMNAEASDSTDGETASMETLATAALDSGGDPSKIETEVLRLNAEDRKKLEYVKNAVVERAKKMPGVSGPLGFFDPANFCSDISEGKLCFYREVEVKHGRVAMLASVGFLVAEQFHPLFGGNIDVPSYIAFQQTPLQTFWPAVVAAIAIPEVYSVFSFKQPWEMESLPSGTVESALWSVKEDRVAGDFSFDPLNLKPKDPKEFKTMQTKELNNGRLAMIAAAGMIAQELATNRKIFDAPF